MSMQKDNIYPLAGGAVKVYAGITGVVILLMMLFGLIMRMTQGQMLPIEPNVFYQLMTAHGIGMVAIAGLGGSAVMWHFLGKYVNLRAKFAWANLAFFLAGVVLVLGGIFIGGFAAAWTFLYPLPANSMGMWGKHAAAAYMGGVLLVGVGMLLFYLESARAIIQKYGSFAKALGWHFLKNGQDAPPATVIASTVVTIINIIAILIGAVILSMMLINLYVPEIAINPLLAKNLIFLFGHVFINSTIYMAVIAVYEILPKYTGRTWKVYKPFVWAWSATCLMVLTVYPHHLLMDYAQPLWMHIMGQIISYTSSLPVLALTLTATLGTIHRSNIKWDLTSALLVLSIFGWSAGVIPAVIDGTIAVNQVMHNTMWVPGHFHLYLLLGCVAMILAFINWIANQEQAAGFSALEKAMLWTFACSAFAYALMFLLSGQASVPRRWAVHFPEWLWYSQIASVFAAGVVLSAMAIVVRAMSGIIKPARQG
ncbi:MAG: cbb3-type cytochrome c oxidase subunit I [Gallionellaceae bacterium]